MYHLFIKITYKFYKQMKSMSQTAAKLSADGIHTLVTYYYKMSFIPFSLKMLFMPLIPYLDGKTFECEHVALSSCLQIVFVAFFFKQQQQKKNLLKST